MRRRHTGLVTAALAVAAVITTGCFDRGKAPATGREQESKRSVHDSAPTKPAHEPPITEAPPTPVTLGPVSFTEAEAAYQAGYYAEAAQLFARYVEQRPANPWGHFMLGLSAWKAGDSGRAEHAFEDALRLDPRHVKSLVNLSRVLLDGNRPGDALDALSRALELDPASNVVHRLLGRAYSAQGKTDAAVDAYWHAIELDGQDSWAMNNLGLLLLEQGRAADALPLLARAVHLRQDVPAFQNNLGMALEHTGHFPAAAVAYSGALEADPDYVKAQDNLARVAQVRSNPQDSFDLAATAQRFAEELEARRNGELVTP
jgi:predicted Zn-dependent protease